MKFFLSILALLISTGLAQACVEASYYDIEDVLLADVVVVGHVDSYKVSKRGNRDRDPNFALAAEIEVRVDEILVGNVPERFHATWSAPFDGMHLPSPDEQFLMGFRHSKSTKQLPWEHRNTADRSSPQVTLALLHEPCNYGFLFPASSEFAQSMRQLLLQ